VSIQHRVYNLTGYFLMRAIGKLTMATGNLTMAGFHVKRPCGEHCTCTYFSIGYLFIYLYIYLFFKLIPFGNQKAAVLCVNWEKNWCA